MLNLLKASLVLAISSEEFKTLQQLTRHTNLISFIIETLPQNKFLSKGLRAPLITPLTYHKVYSRIILMFHLPIILQLCKTSLKLIKNLKSIRPRALPLHLQKYKALFQILSTSQIYLAKSSLLTILAIKE